MSVHLLEPAKKTAIWGGKKLIECFGKKYDGEKLAETWELSVHPDGPAVIVSGEGAGMSLPEWIEKNGRSVLGTNCDKFEGFPVLIKLIDAKEDLSVQVHPDDEYALKNEGQFGKTEMWYVVDCEPGARLCYGCREAVTPKEFREHIADGTLDKVLNYVSVKPGDVFFIKSGTIHAIGAGIVIAEIQQNSNITYRVYDYERTDDQGNMRELHIEQALEVARLSPPESNYDFDGHIGKCRYFETDLIDVDETGTERTVGMDSFSCVLVVEGTGTIRNNDEVTKAEKGNCFFVPAGSGALNFQGNMKLIYVRVP